MGRRCLAHPLSARIIPSACILTRRTTISRLSSVRSPSSACSYLTPALGPPVAAAVASAQQVAPAAVASAQQVAPAVAVPGQQIAPAVGTPLVNVRYTTVPLLPMVLDPTSTHVSPWYTVIVGRFIGVFEDTYVFLSKIPPAILILFTVAPRIKPRERSLAPLTRPTRASRRQSMASTWLRP